jgi:hypothetical protein
MMTKPTIAATASEIIQQAIWLYVRSTLSFRDVEDLLAERGIEVSYETVRRWVNHLDPRSRPIFANAGRSRIPSGISTKSHLSRAPARRTFSTTRSLGPTPLDSNHRHDRSPGRRLPTALTRPDPSCRSPTRQR